MRQILALAALGVAAVWANPAFGQTGFREIPNGYGGRAGYDYYVPGYFIPAVPAYGYRPGRTYNDPHAEAVRRIQATHSRSRFYTHPQSLYNGQPRPDYDPRWPYGY